MNIYGLIKKGSSTSFICMCSFANLILLSNLERIIALFSVYIVPKSMFSVENIFCPKQKVTLFTFSQMTFKNIFILLKKKLLPLFEKSVYLSLKLNIKILQIIVILQMNKTASAYASFSCTSNCLSSFSRK